MKKALSIFVLCSGAVFAADVSPTFREGKIEFPPLSLSESAKQALPPTSTRGEAVTWVRHQAPAAVSEKLFSKMPIVVPGADIDPKILKEPDSSVDFKLIVKSPDVSPAK